MSDLLWMKSERGARSQKSGRRVRSNLFEFYLSLSSQEIGIQEQAGHTKSGKLAACEFAHAGLLYSQDPFQIAGAVSAAFDQPQNILMQGRFQF
jgi:hypothetical protein